MTVSSTNYTDFAYIKEVTRGVTPNTPTFQRLPVTGANLADAIGTAISEVIRSDRQTDDLVAVSSEVGGDCSYELSYGPYKPLLESLLQNTLVTVALTGDVDIAAVAATGFTSTTTDFVAAGLVVGNFFKIVGFDGDPLINGIYRVTSVSANALGTYPLPPSDEAAGDSIDINAITMRNGAETPDSLTFRKQINAPGGTAAIFYYRGCMVNSMSFNFASGSILNGDMNIVGMTSEGTDTAIAGESIDDVAAYDIMNAVSNVVDIDISGLPAGVEFKSLNLTIDNQVNAADAIGTLGAIDLVPFSLSVAGELEMYFEDTVVYNLYKNASAFSVAFTLTDTSGNSLVVYMPKCKFEDLSEPVDGKDNFLMESGSMRALRDAVTNMMVQFTFIPA